MWTYEQATGKLSHNGEHHATGYSGFGEGKNNPAMQHVHDLGPICRGFYTMVNLEGDYEGKKAPVIRLVPKPGNEMFGRDGFLMHGDSVSKPGEASLGCVIENHTERVLVAESPDRDMEVV